jgi:hypothetical protein
VGSLFTLKLTTEFGVKPVPVTASGNAGAPAVALAGTKVPMVGCTPAGSIVNVAGPEVPPPATPFAGFVTVMLTVP